MVVLEAPVDLEVALAVESDYSVEVVDNRAAVLEA